MCKVGGGPENRCDTHKDGSKATIKLTTLLSNVHEKAVRTVFKDLKKEGKGLPEPEKDEVVGYNNTGIWLTKHNANIPDRQKQTIMNQFERAKEEKPSGPLFHAWKHTMPEVMRRTRKTLMATGIASALVFTSACAGNNGENINTAPTSSPTTISAPASPTPIASPSAEKGMINGIPVKEGVASDSHGEYVQTTISREDKAFSYEPGIVDPSATDRFSPEDVKEAHATAVEYAAEAIDTPMNGSPGDTASGEQWWAANKDRFHPDYQEDMKAAALSPNINDTVVYKGVHRKDYGLQYGADKTHVSERSIQTTSIYGGDLNGTPGVVVAMKVNFTNSADVDGKATPEYANGTVSYTMFKDPATGKFLITGSNATWATQPLR